MGRLPALDRSTVTTPVLQRVQPHHRSIARAMFTGMRPHEIASRFGLSPSQVSVITNSPCFRSYLAYLETQQENGSVNIREDLLELSDLAVQHLAEVISDPCAERKQKTEVAFGILDRAGYGKPKESGGGTVIQNINVTNLSTDELRDRVLEMAST